jgi:hypothetical protein
VLGYLNYPRYNCGVITANKWLWVFGGAGGQNSIEQVELNGNDIFREI